MYQCSICYNNYNINNAIPIIIIPCGHTYCSKCIFNLYDYAYSECPLCRGSINNVEINIIVYEIICNIEKHYAEIQKILTKKMQIIIDNITDSLVILVLYNEYVTRYNDLYQMNINTDNSNSSCCIIS